MGKNHNSCNCVRQCPCYPNCDQMMNEGQIPPQWLRRGEQEKRAFVREDVPPVQRDLHTDADEMLAKLIKETVPVPEAIPFGTQRKMELLDETQQMEQRTATAGYEDVPMTDADEYDWQKLKEMYPDMATQRKMELLDETQQMEQRTATAGYEDVPMTDADEYDWQKLKEMYPDMAKIILSEVENVCDSLEYEGSMMFDSIPDKERVRKMTADIYEKVKDRYPKIILSEVENVCDSLEYEGSMMFDSIPDKERVRKMTADIYEKVKDRYPIEESIDQDDMLVMNRENRRRYPPQQNWLNDFIQVLLFQEMHRRRCRHRRCRR